MNPTERELITFCIDHLRRDGAQKWLVCLANGLRKQGFDVCVIALNDALSLSIVEALEKGGVRVVVIGRFPLLLGFGVLRLAMHLYKRRMGAMISALFFSDILGATVARIVGARCSIRAVRARNQDYTAIHWLLQRITAKMRDAVVYNSTAASTYEECKIGAHISCRFVIYNWIPVLGVPSCGRAAVDSIRRHEGEAAERLVIGVLGRLAPQKNVQLILRALAKSARSNITVLVAGEGNLRKDLEHLCSELGVSNQVHFVGYQDDALGFLSNVDLMVSASRFEGQPNALLEAIAVGCPVILSDIEEHRETVNLLIADLDIEPIFFRDNCVDALSEKLADISGRLQGLQKLASAMHSRASVLSEEKMISDWIEILSQTGIQSPVR